MALTFPYPLAFLSRHLEPSEVTFSLKRYDEMSGSGNGQFWTARLAPPLWQVELTLNARYAEEGRAIDAKIMALDGSAKTFLFADPSYRLTADPGDGVTVAAIGESRTTLALAGLPAGYKIMPGHRFSIATANDSHYLATFAEDAEADTEGATGDLSVMPYVPFAVSKGAAVELATPVLRVFIPPDGHKPFAFRAGGYMTGGTLTLQEKRG